MIFTTLAYVGFSLVPFGMALFYRSEIRRQRAAARRRETSGV